MLSFTTSDGGEVGGDIKPGVQLVHRHPAEVHQAGVHLLHGDDRLGASNETSVIEDEDDGSVIRVTVPLTQEPLRAGTQQDPAS